MVPNEICPYPFRVCALELSGCRLAAEDASVAAAVYNIENNIEKKKEFILTSKSKILRLYKQCICCSSKWFSGQNKFNLVWQVHVGSFVNDYCNISLTKESADWSGSKYFLWPEKNLNHNPYLSGDF